MALIHCSECGHEVSDRASACPNCGNPLQPVSSSAPAPAAPRRRNGSKEAAPAPTSATGMAPEKGNHTIAVVALALMALVLWQASPIGYLGKYLWPDQTGQVVIASKTPAVPGAGAARTATPFVPQWNTTDPDPNTNGNVRTAAILISTTGITVQDTQPLPVDEVVANPSQAVGRLFLVRGPLESNQPTRVPSAAIVLGAGTEIDDATVQLQGSDATAVCACYVVGGMAGAQAGSEASVYGYLVGYAPGDQPGQTVLSVLGLGNVDAFTVH